MKYFFVILFFVFTACSPRLSYLGDTYDRHSREVDVYYDDLDIRRTYHVIGLLSANSTLSLDKSLDNIRDTMVKEASKRGADGILFVDFYTISANEDSEVKAKLIRFE